MKIKNIIFYIILICSVSACEKSIETERFMLSSNEKELAPYTLNQTVKFVHSNSYEFDFKVTYDKLNLSRNSNSNRCNSSLFFESKLPEGSSARII